MFIIITLGMAIMVYVFAHFISSCIGVETPFWGWLGLEIPHMLKDLKPSLSHPFEVK